MRLFLASILLLVLLLVTPSLSAEHWVAQTSGVSEDLTDVQALTANTVITVGTTRRALKTTTSGSTWINKYPPAGGPGMVIPWGLNGQHFSSSSVGYACGGVLAGGPASGVVLKTSNGGNDWAGVTQPTNSDILRDVFFISDTTGWVCSGNSDGTLLVFKTTDGGTIWTSASTGLTSERTYYGIFFTDASTGWVVGNPGLIFKTVNGADLWTAQTSGTANQLNDVFFIDSNTGWVAGNGGAILKTVNGGITWTTLTSDTTENLNAVYFADSLNGWAVGANGTIVRTSDGGTNWAAETSGTAVTLNGVYGSGTSHVWAVGDTGVIVKRVIDPTITSAKHGRFTTFSQGGVYTTFTINGVNSNSGVDPAVTFDSAKITAGAVTSFTDTTIVLPVSFALDTAIGNHTLTVTNPGGGSGTYTFQVLVDSAGPTYSSLKINGGDYTSGMSIPFVNTFTADLSDVTGLSVDPTDDLEFTLWIVSGSNTFYKTFTGSDIYTRLTLTTGSFRVVPNHVINFSTGAEVAFGYAVGVDTPFTLTFTAKDIDGNQGNSALTLKFAGQAQGEKTISNVLVPIVKNPTSIPIQFESKENLGVKELPIFSSTQMVSKVTANIVTGTNKVTWDVKTFSGAKAPAGMYIIMIQGVKGKIPVVHWQ